MPTRDPILNKSELEVRKRENLQMKDQEPQPLEEIASLTLTFPLLSGTNLGRVTAAWKESE